MSNDYQRQVIDFYALRHDYDNDFTQARALKLVNYLYLQKSQSVLDVATGTGFILNVGVKTLAFSDGSVKWV